MIVINYLKKLVKKIFFQNPRPLTLNINKKILIHKGINLKIFSFGEKNPDKVFYVIRRSPGAGLFSNVSVVVNHLKYINNLNFIPVVDMKNFPTWYNENYKINNTFNAWNYYFVPLSKYSLDEVYSSKRVLISENEFSDNFNYNISTSEELIDIFNKNIFIINKFKKCVDLFIKKNFFNKKVLGVHFRGTSYKQGWGQPLAASIDQIINKIDYCLDKKNFNKIFLVTEEEKYLRILKKRYKDILCYYQSSFRSYKDDAFKIYPRKLHRYKLGRSILVEAYTLAKCDGYIDVDTNVRQIVNVLKHKDNYINILIDNGMNLKNRFISRFYWYIRQFLFKR